MTVCFVAICKLQVILSHSVTIVYNLGLNAKAAMQSNTASYCLQPKLLDWVVVTIHV